MIYLILLLQSTVLEAVKIFGVKPNLFLLFIVSIAILRGNIEGAIIGFFAGLAQDMSGGRYFGFYTILGMYLGFLSGSINRSMYKENYLVIIFFTLISTVLYEGSVYYLDNIIHSIVVSSSGIVPVSPGILWALRFKIVPELLYNCIAILPVYALMVKLDGMFDRLGHSYGKY